MAEMYDLMQHMAKACECGSAKWHLLRNGQIECAKCATRPDGLNWSEHETDNQTN